MRFEIQVQGESKGNGWTVRVFREGNPAALCERSLRPLPDQPPGQGEPGFPLPDLAELAGQENSPHYALCTAQDPDVIAGALSAVRNREWGGGVIKKFADYTLAVLLGGQAWNAIVNAADQDPIELLLSFADSASELARLPWEMIPGALHLGGKAPGRLVSVTRVVKPGTTQGLPDQIAVSAPLRVLFVVGTTLQDAEIEPAAEYMSLLRRMDEEQNALNSRILVEASLEDVRDTLTSFRPDVVHFVCHGIIEDRQVKLELTSGKKKGDKEPHTAAAVGAALLEDGLRPLVVLNACYTAGQYGQDSVPFAADLIQQGIPAVVAMSGPVADHACRLFTRRFYDALLRGGSITLATAKGRAAAFVGSAKPDETADWSFPTLFIAQGVSPVVKIDPLAKVWADNLGVLAKRYRTLNTPLLFCDRVDILTQAFHQMLSIGNKATPRVISARVEDPEDAKTRYGKTRLLEELAARAVIDGHAPCRLLYSETVGDVPGTPDDLYRDLYRKMQEVRAEFGLSNGEYELQKLRRKLDTPAADIALSPAILDLLGWYDLKKADQVEKARRDVIPVAIREDLVQLSAELALRAENLDVPASREEMVSRVDQHRKANPHAADHKVLVLIDDVHRFEKRTLDTLLETLIGPDGMGREGHPVPVALTYSWNVGGEASKQVEALKKFSGKSFVTHLKLGPFPPPSEDPIPYRQFLLGLDNPMMFETNLDAAGIAKFLAAIYKWTGGVPFRFFEPKVQGAVEGAAELGNLIRATDVELMNQVETLLGGGKT